MNELSWLIYAADVVGNLRWLAGSALIATIPISIAGGLVWLMCHDGYSSDETGERADRIALRVAKALFPWLVVAVIITAVVPSRSTIYAIAASEMGERVIESETGSKAVEALNAWLDRQISGGTSSAPPQEQTPDA